MPKYPGAIGTNTISSVVPAQIDTSEAIYLFGTTPAGSVPPPNDANVVGETVVTGNSSVAFTMLGAEVSAGAPGVSFEFRFSAAPGAFEIDIQEADTDADNFYILMTGSTAYKVTAVNATTFIARVDLIPTGGRFMRVTVVLVTNAVTLVAKATALG